MKTNTVPKVTLKRISTLSRSDLFDLTKALEAITRKHANSLTPGNLNNAWTTLKYCYKRKATLKRGFFKGMTNNAPSFNKRKSDRLSSGTLWDTKSINYGAYETMIKAYALAMGIDVNEAENICKKHATHLRETPAQTYERTS